MDIKTTEETISPKISFEWEVITIGFLLGLCVCLILALIYSIWIIMEQDTFIHELLLKSS
ncbi:hypothetical protein M9991_12445 [Chryseobacterium gallinarum]|uniref:hypothetical protein n=1 Tax=Chryseobacterium gallinarum TaxID=1324352 RepID=UPI002023D9D1|nr:hypothetical protein [Chryseobacterium gallinarum]MCL8537674.1 hypothetical protein [Chryseobacterium gallinarum]